MDNPTETRPVCAVTLVMQPDGTGTQIVAVQAEEGSLQRTAQEADIIALCQDALSFIQARRAAVLVHNIAAQQVAQQREAALKAEVLAQENGRGSRLLPFLRGRKGRA